MRVLITNDDGVRAPGIAALAEAAVALGHDVIVAAPLDDHSGYGTAVGPLHVDGRVSYERVDMEVAGVDAFGVDGPPALAALCAVLGGFGEPPDLVVSGINAGLNTGRAVLHSGTVGAAMTAAQCGIPSIAVSLELAPRWHWDTAASVVTALLSSLPDTMCCESVVNVNIPNRPLAAVVGVCPAPPARGGTVQAVFGEPATGVLQLSFRNDRSCEPTDDDLVAAGWVTVGLVRLPALGDGTIDEWIGGVRRLVRVPTVA